MPGDMRGAGAGTVTAAQMKEIERRAADAGLSYRAMMENAGSAAARFIGAAAAEGPALVFCGSGNNGGDGLVVARLLHERGWPVGVVLVDGEPRTPDSAENMRLVRALGLPVQALPEAGEPFAPPFGPALLIDAIYGTGFHGALPGRARRAAQYMNAAGLPVFSLDLPSGVNADTGRADADAVRASQTLAFHRRKPAHLLEAAAPYCGGVVCLDIGIEEACARG